MTATLSVDISRPSGCHRTAVICLRGDAAGEMAVAWRSGIDALLIDLRRDGVAFIVLDVSGLSGEEAVRDQLLRAAPPSGQKRAVIVAGPSPAFREWLMSRLAPTRALEICDTVHEALVWIQDHHPDAATGAAPGTTRVEPGTVAVLRDRTGARLDHCRRALIAARGNLDLAEARIREANQHDPLARRERLTIRPSQVLDLHTRTGESRERCEHALRQSGGDLAAAVEWLASTHIHEEIIRARGTLLGEIVKGLVGLRADQVRAALEHAERDELRIGEALVALGFCTPRDIARALAAQGNVPYVELPLTGTWVEPDLVDRVPYPVAHEYMLIPLRLDGDVLTVATEQPLGTEVLDNLRFTLGARVRCVVAEVAAIHSVLAFHYREDWRDAKEWNRLAEEATVRDIDYGAGSEDFDELSDLGVLGGFDDSRGPRGETAAPATPPLDALMDVPMDVFASVVDQPVASAPLDFDDDQGAGAGSLREEPVFGESDFGGFPGSGGGGGAGVAVPMPTTGSTRSSSRSGQQRSEPITRGMVAPGNAAPAAPAPMRARAAGPKPAAAGRAGGARQQAQAQPQAPARTPTPEPTPVTTTTETTDTTTAMPMAMPAMEAEIAVESRAMGRKSAGVASAAAGAVGGLLGGLAMGAAMGASAAGRAIAGKREKKKKSKERANVAPAEPAPEPDLADRLDLGISGMADEQNERAEREANLTRTGAAPDMQLVEVIRREAAVRYFSQMNPGKVFPLSVKFTQQKLQEWVKKQVRQVVAEEAIEVTADDPFVTVRPHFPGCHVTPAELTVDLSADESEADFRVAPFARGSVGNGGVDIVYQGKVVQTIATPFRLTTQKLSKATATMSFLSPAFFMGLQAKKLDFVSQAQQGFPLLADLTTTLGGPFNLGLALGGVLLATAGLFFWWKMPKASDPIRIFYNGPGG